MQKSNPPLTHCACKSEHCGFSDMPCFYPETHPDVNAEGVDADCGTAASVACCLACIGMAGIFFLLLYLLAR